MVDKGRYDEAIRESQRRRFRPRGKAARAYAVALRQTGQLERARDLQRKKRRERHLVQAPAQWLPIDTKSMALPDTRQWKIELTLPNGVVLNMSTDG